MATAVTSSVGRRRDRKAALADIAGATFAVVLLGLLWRVVRYGLAFPLWGDEAFVAVTVLERDFGGLWSPPEFFQIVPPAFLWCEWLAVRLLGPGEWPLRLLPFAAGIGSLLLFWRFSRGVTTRRTTLVAVAILGASFYPVRHATEVKPYATDLLVSLVLTILGWWTYRRIDSLPRWLATIVAASIGVWCSYPAVFPAAAVAMLLAVRVVRERPVRAKVCWCGYTLATSASWVAVYLLFAGPQAKAAPFLTELVTWKDSFPPIAEPWRLPWWLVQVHTGMMLAYPQGGHQFGSTVTALLVVAGSLRIARRRRPLLLLLLGPLLPALIAAALHRYPYGTSTRVMLYMAPAFCLLAAEGLMAILQALHRTKRGPLVVAALLAVIPLAGIAYDLHRPYFGFDNVLHRRLADRISLVLRADDAVVVFNGVTPPPRIPDLMITRWLQRVAEARYDLQRDRCVPVRWSPDPRTIQPAPGGRLWLIVQRHGDARFFSEERLAEYQSALAARFGLPQFFDRHDLPRQESWTILAYPAWPSAVAARAETRRR